MVFQGFNLIDRLTVMENVLAGRLGYVSLFQAITRRYPPEDIERAFTLMERVGIAQYANKRADELSGGERQRVGVVRALMQEPEVLLADEPTASLDPRTSEQIMMLLQSLASELSLPVLINIHNVAQAKTYIYRAHRRAAPWKDDLRRGTRRLQQGRTGCHLWRHRGTRR